jgi:hypothetical protein
MSTTVTAPVRAQIAVMAARGIAAERIAALLGLDPKLVAAELRWLGPAAAKPAAVKG